jgi:hypothetical protein
MTTSNLQRVAVACGGVWLGFAAEEVSVAIPASERAALIALYNSTDGAGWDDRTNWRDATDTTFAPPAPSALGTASPATRRAATLQLGLSLNLLSGPIPPAALRAFLDSKQIGGDWESTQTVAPSDLTAGAPGPDTVPLSWTPILYTADTGGYRIWYGTQAGGPYSLGGTTAGKTVAASAVGGLSPGQLRVRPDARQQCGGVVGSGRGARRLREPAERDDGPRPRRDRLLPVARSGPVDAGFQKPALWQRSFTT